MANKRKSVDRKEKLIKNGKKLIDVQMGSSVLDNKKRMIGGEIEIKKMNDNLSSTNQISSLSSLSWLMNLSAASLFTGSQHTSSCDGQITNETSTKPGLTYTELIEKALKENGELTVSEIYKWIYSNYPYYKKNDGRWKNSIRHNLSINPQFRKGVKCNNGGHFWTLNKEYDEQFKKWQEHKKLTKTDKRKRHSMKAEEDEVERATRSIMLLDENHSNDETLSMRIDTDPSLVRVDILNSMDKQIEVDFMNKTDTSSAPIIVEEDIFECSDPILADSLLFSDCLELGFQPYELIESRL